MSLDTIPFELLEIIYQTLHPCDRVKLRLALPKTVGKQLANPLLEKSLHVALNHIKKNNTISEPVVSFLTRNATDILIAHIIKEHNIHIVDLRNPLIMDIINNNVSNNKVYTIKETEYKGVVEYLGKGTVASLTHVLSNPSLGQFVSTLVNYTLMHDLIYYVISVTNEHMFVFLLQDTRFSKNTHHYIQTMFSLLFLTHPPQCIQMVHKHVGFSKTQLLNMLNAAESSMMVESACTLEQMLKDIA